MGRKAKDVIDVAQYIYPLMQAVDIKALEVDVAHAGMDQRKVHMLVRDIYPKLDWKPPVAVHHHLLIGLQEPRPEGFEEDKELDIRVSSKMSKSKPSSAIFVHDAPQEVEKKVKAAWCPPRVATNNPVLELAKYVVFRTKKEFVVERPAKYGGDVAYGSYEELERDYVEGRLHPLDLKLSVAREINEVIDPVRRLLLADRKYLELLS
jgi:tyrosyl-tRNA synthetase